MKSHGRNTFLHNLRASLPALITVGADEYGDGDHCWEWKQTFKKLARICMAAGKAEHHITP